MIKIAGSVGSGGSGSTPGNGGTGGSNKHGNGNSKGNENKARSEGIKNKDNGQIKGMSQNPGTQVGRKKSSSSSKNKKSPKPIQGGVKPPMPKIGRTANNQNEQEQQGKQTGDEDAITPASAGDGTGVGRKAGNAGQNLADKGKKLLKNKKAVAFIAAHIIPITIIVLVIIAIIMLIGQFMFFTTMPGMILEKVKKFGLSVWADFVGFFTGDPVTANVSSEDVLSLAQYLQNQGYDIESCGFGKAEYEGDQDSSGSRELKKIGETPDGKEYLKAYIASNEATYVLSTYSIAGFLKETGSILNAFIKADPSEIGSNKEYSTGMINILNTTISPDSRFVKINRKAEKMIVYTDAIYDPILDMIPGVSGNIQWGSTFSYDLSTWTSKYGKPTELSLALHLSTMMPDLAYRICRDQEMNTKVNIVLQDVTLNYSTVVQGPNGESISEEEIVHNFLYQGLEHRGNKFDIYQEKEVPVEEEEEEESSDTSGTNNSGTVSGPGNRPNTTNQRVSKLPTTSRRQEQAVDPEGGSTRTIEERTHEGYESNDTLWEQKLQEATANGTERQLFLEVMDDVRGKAQELLAGVWGINILHIIGEENLIEYLENTIKGVISKLIGAFTGGSEYYVYLKQGSDIVPGMNISYDALFELAQIVAMGDIGVQHVKFPYIQSVTNHWYFKDIDFSKGVYKKAAAAKKKIIYEPAEGDTALTREGIKVELDGLLTAEEGIVYQVCEPEAVGPNDHIKEIFADEYFKYDGSDYTAKQIELAKQIEAVMGEGFIDVLAERQESGTLTDIEKNTLISLGVDLETTMVSREPVSFEGNKSNALAAFQIVENMHSEEADFIYRHLKDLVVELNYFTKSELTTELKACMMWPIQVGTGDKEERFSTAKDEEEFGLTIEGVQGRTIVAPEECEISTEGDVVSLKFTKMSDTTLELLKYIYQNDYKTINPDILVGLTMKIQGITLSKTGTAHRGDVIGTANGDVNIKMLDLDMSLIEDIEEFMSQKHNNEYERVMQKKKDTPREEGQDIGRIGTDNFKFPEGTGDHTNYFDDSKTFPSLKVEEEEVYNKLRELGYTCEGACAIMGIIRNESGFDVNATNPYDGGYGLIQWTNTSGSPRLTNLKTWCQNHNYEYNTLEGQLAFFDYELKENYNGRYKVYDTLKTSHDLEYCLEMFFCHDVAGTNVILTNEGQYAPSTPYSTQALFDMRLSDANAYYKIFKEE